MTDCLIIGGGLIGMLTGHELLKRGLTITICERGPFGREASWAGGGILSPLYPWRYAEAVTCLALAGQQRYPELIREVYGLSGIDPEWLQSGLLLLNANDHTTAIAWANKYNVALEWLNPATVQQKIPGLMLTDQAIAWLPEVAQVRNPRFIKAMEACLQKQGAVLQSDTSIEKIATAQGRVTGVYTAAGQFQAADRIVIANGAWSGQLLESLGLALPVYPVRGQMLLLRASEKLFDPIILQDKHYLIPRQDGRIVVGSTVEQTDFVKETTDIARAQLLEFVKALLPKLADLPIEKHWAGLRPGCGQGIPYIGEHPAIQGLFVNAGHFRNGIVMAPAAAALLTDLLMGTKPALDPTPYALH